MPSVRCSQCGHINRIEDPERLPRCESCDGSLSTGELVEERTAGDNTAEAAKVEAVGDNVDGSVRHDFPCTCEGGGGPSAGDPALCFQCGGMLRDETSDEEPGRTGTGFTPDPAPEFSPAGKTCVLVLPDGRRVRVGNGVLVSRLDPTAPIGGAGVVAVGAPSVSRKHAWLRETDVGVEVVDLGSTNGTWVAGRRIESLRPRMCTSDADVEIAFSRGLRAVLSFQGGG